MTSPPELTRYERFGWHYDAVAADRYRPGEARFYAELARTAHGLVLEPACGSGRILSLAWRAGQAVVGTDASQTMLDRAAARFRQLAAQPNAPEQPVRLLRQPLQELALAEGFGLILLPLEAFRLLRSQAEQESFLVAAAAHLVPHGRLALDLTLPEAALPRRTSLGPLNGPDGRAVSATVRWRQEAMTPWRRPRFTTHAASTRWSPTTTAMSPRINYGSFLWAAAGGSS